MPRPKNATRPSKKKRQREKEEYDYAFEREKRLARDQFEDQKKQLEAELTALRATVERELQEREGVVAAQEAELLQLRQKVEGLPKELDSAVQKAIKETSERLRLEAKNREELLVKEVTGEKNVLTARIESLEKTVSEQHQLIAKLSQTAEKAYEQVQDIAVRAVEGSSGTKVLTGLQQFMAEQQKKAFRDQQS